MKSAGFTILFIFCHLSFADVVVPENVLKEWGYETTEVRENSQDIKRIKAERWDENHVYYPRFTISKSCFDTLEKVIARQQEILENQKNDPFEGFKSHYNDFIRGNCLYSISTAARATYLSYQPDVLNKYKAYMRKNENP